MTEPIRWHRHTGTYSAARVVFMLALVGFILAPITLRPVVKPRRDRATGELVTGPRSPGTA